MNNDKYTAKIILGGQVTEVAGEDAFDIINKILPAIQQARERATTSGNPDDIATLQALDHWLYSDFTNPGDMHRLDRFDFTFSFTRLACTGVEGKKMTNYELRK